MSREPITEDVRAQVRYALGRQGIENYEITSGHLQCDRGGQHFVYVQTFPQAGVFQKPIRVNVEV